MTTAVADTGALYVLRLAPNTYVVNSTDDDPDASISDGVCDTGGTNLDGATKCTFRAAIEQANAHVGQEKIDFSIPTTELGYNGSAWQIFTHIGSTAPYRIGSYRWNNAAQLRRKSADQCRWVFTRWP